MNSQIHATRKRRNSATSKGVAKHKRTSAVPLEKRIRDPELKLEDKGIRIKENRLHCSLCCRFVTNVRHTIKSHLDSKRHRRRAQEQPEQVKRRARAMQLITDHFGEPNAKSLDTEEHASRFVRCVPVLSAHHAANMGVVESTLLLQYNEAKRESERKAKHPELYRQAPQTVTNRESRHRRWAPRQARVGL